MGGSINLIDGKDESKFIPKLCNAVKVASPPVCRYGARNPLMGKRQLESLTCSLNYYDCANLDFIKGDIAVGVYDFSLTTGLDFPKVNSSVHPVWIFIFMSANKLFIS